MLKGYLNNNNKAECFGCEACVQTCPTKALKMVEDNEGFNYPAINLDKCIKCNKCHSICPLEKQISKNKVTQKCYGGYIKDKNILQNSTSGGIFSAIIDSYCDKDYAIFGAQSDGIKVFHSFVLNKSEISKYRKSKYSQSIIGDSYKQVKTFLSKNMKVVFSGTPCQIAALYSFLGKTNTNNLLTIEVICEGIPSPLYIKKYNHYLLNKYKSTIREIDYRNKDNPKKWDLETMKITLDNDMIIKKDRWFNPYWKLWLQHLMSRPSCYKCPFTTKKRCADITLGDLWGVHLYCPELYNSNRGASLVIANNEKGSQIINKIQSKCILKELNINEAIKYQSPLRKPIEENYSRNEFIKNLINTNINYKELINKWYNSNKVIIFINKYVINRLHKNVKYIFKKERFTNI